MAGTQRDESFKESGAFTTVPRKPDTTEGHFMQGEAQNDEWADGTVSGRRGVTTGLSLRMPRRSFLVGSTAALASPVVSQSASANPVCCIGDNPVGCIRGSSKFKVLVALLEAQLESLWCGPPGDHPVSVADDVLRYAEHLETRYQQGVCAMLLWLDIYSLRRMGRKFASLSTSQRRQLLNQGESSAGRGILAPPMIRWDEEYVLHTGVSSMMMLARMVTLSRPPARDFIGLGWSKRCKNPKNLAHVDAPPYPDLDAHYDMCIIGSGAAGATVAARAVRAGKRVLIVEAGDWISPDELVVRRSGTDGETELSPARADHVLSRLYKNGGLQLAGGLNELSGDLSLLLPSRRRRVQPQQAVNVLQAEVVGGGPYVNNAIHLPIEEEVWNDWGDRRPAGVDFAVFQQRMNQINQDLGVNQKATTLSAGLRSLKFAEGCAKSGEEVYPAPVSIIPTSDACGSDNSVDAFGDHVGGVHPWHPDGPNSSLMRALQTPEPARLAYRLKACYLDLHYTDAGAIQATRLVVEDRRGLGPSCRGPRRVIHADRFVLAAGAIASTNILRQSLCRVGLHARELGQRVTGNVGTPVYAVYDKPIWNGETERPEPGIAQCFIVDRRMEHVGGRRRAVEPTLENWFHFPGTVALALSGWFQEYAQVMQLYNHISVAGMVVPTEVRPENRIDANGDLHLSLNRWEFELMLRGIERIGRIYLATATSDNGVTLHLPTKAVLLNHCDQPLRIRTLEGLRSALDQIRRRGPAFLNLLTAHPQGGNPLGGVVDRRSFRVVTCDGQEIDNLYVADASIFPAGCEINPQLTVKALAGFVADRAVA